MRNARLGEESVIEKKKKCSLKCLDDDGKASGKIAAAE